MSSFEIDNTELEFLLPYGENIRPLLTASGLSEYDLKFLLQKRGVFVHNSHRNNTVPEIAGTLLSPKEFEILRNRQSQKEGNIKRSTAKTDWIDDSKSLIDSIDPDIEDIIKKLTNENSPYMISKLIKYSDGVNKVIIQGEIRRNDWTRDVFSSTSFHPWKVVIEKLSNNTIEYIAESTTPETKDLINKIQNTIHKKFQQDGYFNPNKEIQKVLSTSFLGNNFLFEYLSAFTKNSYNSLKFQRIIDIETGLDEKKNFPENLKWLKGNIGEIRLTAMKGKKLEQTDIVEAGKTGILVFGEIDAEFTFEYDDVSGKCVIQFGFPKYYLKHKSIEFETKIGNIELDSLCSHVSKESVKRYLLAEFQREKHNIFEEFVKDSKVDLSVKTKHNQYLIGF